MIPYRRLLLATEHTEFDAGAERVALELARRQGVPLAGVLPLVTNDEAEAVAPAIVARMEKDAHARVAALRDAAAQSGVALDLVVRRGDEPWRAIVAEAKARDADLVVIRRRGKRSFLAQLMIGEMVGRVGTSAPCDVLMVPRAAPLWTQGVLAGIDGTGVGPLVARAAARVAVAAKLPLTVASVALHDTPVERAAADSVVAAAMQVAQGEGARVDRRVTVGNPAEAVSQLATDVGADLVVVGRGGPQAHGRLHFGSNARRIVGLAPCAVLVVRT